MPPTEDLPPVPPNPDPAGPFASVDPSSGPVGADERWRTADPAAAASSPADDVWPAAGPAKGLRVRLPIAVAALAVVAFGGVAAGAALKKTPAATVQAGAVGGSRAFGVNGGAGANGSGRFGGGVFGTITKVEGNTITVTQRDGTTATVVVPSGTAITKTVSGTLADLTAGTEIAVRGATADGKTTAESVTINPPNGGGSFGPGSFNGPRSGTGTTPTTTR
jgi:hypothetical protein